MELTINKIPNKALTGDEVKEIMCKEFRAMLEREYYMTRVIAFRRVSATLTATFHLGEPFKTPQEVKSRLAADSDTALEGEYPLTNADDSAVVVGLERDVKLENPNADRISHDMPIRIQEREMPMPISTNSPIPGEVPAAITSPYPSVKTTEIRYDKSQAPATTPPVDRDVSEKKAAEIGGKARKK